MKTILITGATRGLGRAMAEFFASAGHKVIGCGTKADAVAQLGAALGPPHSFAVVNVARDTEVKGWANAVLSEHGAPDFLINNAAVIARNAPLWVVPATEFDRTLDVNVKGTANTIRYFVPAMIARRTGVIVNFSSGWGRSTSPEVAPYCASKFAIEGLTQAFAKELPHGLAAVALNPGIIATDMLRSTFGGEAAGYVTPEQWVKKAGPFILELGPKDNGASVTVPE
ncbi:MAG: SDR family oxidoreductase [Verrucomicrobiota bacterium]